ncbi:YkvA family protein [Blastococcus goldschmidtiae]|uniref:YkvA family protein n=1 Tax=Blastococcus goldschmidtiae TaxID=3075546 RepID=A0ABU2KDW7_9ACTN|nr:YkvA family protein [Blastococcus sp. DSM 46792]MDT0278378.1 YkvA family protein [Blastococcus sp. DSM 46792]
MDRLGTAAAVAGGLLLLWVALLLLVWRSRSLAPREALRLLPDLVRLVRRLAADRSLPRGVRIRLWLLLVYLVSPLDLVPDVIPLLGHADDVVLVAWTLRSVTRRAGTEALARHWPGEPAGLALVSRLAGLPAAGTPPG